MGHPQKCLLEQRALAIRKLFLLLAAALMLTAWTHGSPSGAGSNVIDDLGNFVIDDLSNQVVSS